MKKSILVLSLLVFTQAIEAESYEEFMAEMNSEYKGFITQMDKDFAKALGKEWKEFDTTIQPTYPEPKPVVLPIAPKAPEPVVDDTPKIVVVVIKHPEPKELEQPIVPSIPTGYKKLSLNFFAQEITIVYHQKLNHSIQQFNNRTIANYWRYQSSIEIKNLLNQIRAYQKSLTLNDWHLYLLVQDIAKSIVSEQENQELLSWFILNKLGYDVKLGVEHNDIYMMPSINQRIYGVSFMNTGQRDYYAFEHRNKIQTYKANFANNRPLNLAEAKVPTLSENIQTRVLSFDSQGKSYRIRVPYNKNLMDLYSSYPALDFKYYFRQPIDPRTKFELFKQLKDLMQDMTELQAVNFLLHLTQHSFTYATDGQQFGRERSLFFGETLNYPYSDCEDRSIFFGKLVKELLGLNVLALHYPIHLATAVEFKSNVKGESITYQNKRYIICDPTYVGANIGRAMPQFKGIKDIKIIPINY